ncbi:MAG: insulinase family protein, partial [Thermoflexibacter sp.]|nr:insulinase family protein [Thermoflexibacter sp.]
MKKIYFLFLALGCFVSLSSAQEATEFKLPIPLDPAVRTGKLPNGITYYLRRNNKPEKRLIMRLAINAGSMQEDDDQLGLAHFSEHMLFNGTKNFPKNELVKFLQSTGVKSGADLNAYTSFDETVYELMLPSDSASIVEKGFQVLEDWASSATFDNTEIDKERGVVIEEWRLGRGAEQRMFDKYFPIMYKDSRYASRLPIGKKEILESFKYETIKRFYKDWYRPDLMGVVVVGDMDLNEMEKKVKQHFSKIKPADKKARKKELFPVPDHKETYVSILTDKEATQVNVQVMYKHPKMLMNTREDMRKSMIHSLYNGMFGRRLDEIRQLADPPFSFAYSGYGSETRSKDSYFAFAIASEVGAERALKTLLEENQRVKKFGFTQGELDRYKKVLLKRYEQGYNERNKTESEQFAQEYVSLFLENEPSPGIEFEYEFYKKHLEQVTLEEINELAKKWITSENRVVIITAPDKETVKLPTEERVRKMLIEAGTASLKPYEDKAVATSLMTKMPVAGKVTAEKKIESLGITEVTLSNGVKVVLKPTDFKNDEILLSAYSVGGQSIYADTDMYNAQYASAIVGQSGVATYSTTDLNKMMSGKTVRVNPSVNQLTEGFNGSFSPADIESAFQMIHLYFTEPRKDAEAYQSFVSKQKSFIQNLTSNPQFFFLDAVTKITTQNHPRSSGLPKAEDFDKINYDRAFEIYRERFADASDFTFFFVGNFKLEEIKPMLETYLGSLPATNRQENWKDLGIRPPKGIVEKEVLKGTDPKSLVALVFSGEAAYSRKEAYLLSSLAELLNIKLIESVREDQGGVYGINAFCALNKFPYSNYTCQIQFPCAPENVEKLTQVAISEVKKIQEKGPDEADLNKVKETQKRTRETNLKENRYWLTQLQSYYFQGDNVEQLNEADKAIDVLSAKAMQETAL